MPFLKVGALEQLLATFSSANIPFSPPVSSVTIFTQQLVFFWDCSSDGRRVATLASLVLASCAQEDQSQNFLRAAASKGHAELTTWAHLTARLCAIALQTLATETTASGRSPSINAMVEALVEPTHSESDYLSLVALRLTGDSASPLYSALQSHDARVYKLALRICFIALDSPSSLPEPWRQRAIECFVSRVLSNVDLQTERYFGALLDGLTVVAWWKAVEAAITFQCPSGQPQTSSTAPNLLSLAEGKLEQVNSDQATKLVSLLHQFTAECSSWTFEDATELPGDDDADEEAPSNNGIKGLEMLVLQTKRKLRASVRVDSRTEAMKAGIGVLLRDSTITILFDSLLPSLQARNDASEAAMNLCALYGILCAQAPAHIIAPLLHTLNTQVPNCCLRLWNALSPHPDIVLAPDSARGAMLLFCSVYSRSLLACNDDDFFKAELPMPLIAQQAVSERLRGYLRSMLWDHSLYESPLVVDLQLLLTASKVFNQVTTSPSCPKPSGSLALLSFLTSDSAFPIYTLRFMTVMHAATLFTVHEITGSGQTN